jgi:hypothetical protein
MRRRRAKTRIARVHRKILSSPQPSTVGLVAHYKLWAGPTSPGKVFDYSLGGFEGTLTGTDIAPAYPGFRLNGTDDLIDMTLAGPSSVRSVLVWVNADSTSGDHGIIDLNTTDTFGISEGKITSFSGFLGGNTTYVDGIAGNRVSANWHLTGITGPVANNANALRIGVGGPLLAGLLGDTMLFSSELSAVEMKNVYELTRWRYDV